MGVVHDFPMTTEMEPIAKAKIKANSIYNDFPINN
ncbi:hypothetical protein ArsFIN_05920 [Arsenophonus nasoniae]|uniref:Uncharacterized protein n=1 Tax=Arsenophonus nasoniae TaxID=638 RepID=A0A4P7KQ02_9GAMM|nr:hypothetical protein ArsFIN_05920 [Arsenophonus nasoniae]